MSLFSGLHCPYCASPLEFVWPERTTGALDYGICVCACHEYPVVDGIPILQQLDGLHRVCEFIRQRQEKRALLQALHVFRIRWARRSVWHRVQYHIDCRRLVSDANVAFEEAAQLARKPKVFADYLVHRYANPSFLAAIGPMVLLRGLARGTGAGAIATVAGGTTRRPVVLDLACGAGHAGFLMQILCPGLTVISADQDFVSLYLAKRFLASGTSYLCWDVEAQSPLPDGCVDAVFCLDAFHYFKSKRAVVSELKRLVTTEALWLFPHLHNRLQHNLVAGIPLSPEKYVECFALPDGRLFDETEMLLALSQRSEVDLSEQAPVSKLNKAHALTFVAGGRDVWRAHEGFASVLCRNRPPLAVNPIYHQQWDGDTLGLRLTWPNDTFRRECSSVTAVLPSSYELKEPELRLCRESGEAPDLNQVGDLVAKFVLVPLASRYRSSGRA